MIDFIPDCKKDSSFSSAHSVLFIDYGNLQHISERSELIFHVDSFQFSKKVITFSDYIPKKSRHFWISL